jgi:integral membrane protein (TIGR01906 family)
MKRFKITDLGIGLVFTLLFISLSVMITINFRPLYYYDVKALDIVKDSGYPKEEILKNYNALIDYSSPFFRGDLKFPTLPASEAGLIHFAEVKNIFTFFYVLGAVTLIAGIFIIIYKHKRKDFSYLLSSSILSIVLPLIIGLFLATNFDRTFVIFHKLFFRNNYWLFDPDTDPVIKILPDTFFMHCALMIILLVFLGSMISLIIYIVKRRHFNIRYRKSNNLRF